MQAVDIGLEHGALALGLDGGVHLPLGLLHHLLDAGGVDAAVQNELLQSQPGNLPADRVKAGDGDGLGRVVDDEIHAGQRFQGPDVPALAADNPALHFVVGQRHHADGGLGHMVGGAALDGQRDDLPGLGVRLVLQAGLDLLDLHGRLVGDVLLQLLQEVVLGLLGGEAGDPLQHLQLALLHLLGLGLGGLQLVQAVCQLLFLLLNILGLAVQVLFLLLEAALLLLKITPALLFFLFVLVAGLQDLLLGLHQRLTLLALGALVGLIDDALGLLLGGANLLLGRLLAPLDAYGNPHRHTDHDTNDRCDDIG